MEKEQQQQQQKDKQENKFLVLMQLSQCFFLLIQTNIYT